MTDARPARYFTNARDWRDWLALHHDSESDIWLGFWKVHTRQPTISNAEAVDEALCFGWIDAQMTSVDQDRWRKRFTRRKPDSVWSNVNLRRFQQLEELGRVTPAGRTAYENRKEGRQGIYAYENEPRELPEEYAAMLAADPKALSYWESCRPSYRKVAVSWVVTAKRQGTRDKRMRELVDDCRAGRPIRTQRYGR